MDEIKLEAQIREESEIGRRKIKALRAVDLVPAVVYGGEQKKPTPIKLSRRKYQKIVRSHGGGNVVFHLNVMDGEKKLMDYSAIVREEQHDPVHDKLLHIDFLRISLKEEIEVKVAIIPRGEAVGVKKDGGSVDQPIHELDVICLPTSIPDNIPVNIENLEIGDAIHVKDLTLPEGVKTEHDPEAMVLSIVPPMKEEEEVQTAEGEEPEIVGEGEEKKEGEEETPAEEGKAEDKGEEKAEKKKEEKKEE